MAHRVKVAGWWVGAALVAAVLAVGAREAFASSSLSSCPNDGYNTVGSQPSYFACVSACYAVHGEELAGVQWNSSTTCCRCLL